MSNKELHLFVFEGFGAEPKYAGSLENKFLGQTFSIKCVYDAEIYQLYRQMKDDDFATDIVTILKERSQYNAKLLKNYSSRDFAYVYLFFDYDAHSTMADDGKIAEMLSFFNNETENGMLYLSYPMVEAIRHFRDMDSFKDLSVKCKRGTDPNQIKCPYKDDCDDLTACLKEEHYKSAVPKESLPQLQHISKYDYKIWQELSMAHIFKMNYIVNDSFSMPLQAIPQTDIFKKQLEKYINHKCPRVAVLSAFPAYTLDYFGPEKTRRMLGL